MPPHSEILGRIDQFNKSTDKKTPTYEIFDLVKYFFHQFNKSTRNSLSPESDLQILGIIAQFNKSTEEKTPT